MVSEEEQGRLGEAKGCAYQIFSFTVTIEKILGDGMMMCAACVDWIRHMVG